MNDSLTELTVSLAGRQLAGVWDLVSRYCGLPWSGGDAEVWAFAYYDNTPIAPANEVTAVDVAVAGVLQSGLSRTDLAFFVAQRDRIGSWLEDVPVDVPLHLLDDTALRCVTGLATWDGVGLSLLTKVLHRKRPAAVPLVERHVIDLYRPVTGERSVIAAYPAIVHAVRSDLAAGALEPLTMISDRLHALTGQRLSPLRVADIAIWMGAMS
jgi:hypothetical protein